MKTIARPFFIWLALGGVAAVIAGFLLPSNVRPPWPVQREEQRRIVHERVQAIGGWDALRQECVVAFGNFTTNNLLWPFHDYSGPNIPPAILQLRPREVRVWAYPDEPVIARIKLFGMHRTGARGIPYYGIWVVCSPAPTNFTPRLDQHGVTITGKTQKIADSIFEVY